jgi:hypothetical protein
MKIKVYSLAVDVNNAGTSGGAFATRKDAFVELIQQLTGTNDTDADLAAYAWLDAGMLPELEDYLSQRYGQNATWSHDEHEIDVPVIDELLAVLQRIRRCPDAEIVHSLVDATLAKVKGQP